MVQALVAEIVVHGGAGVWGRRINLGVRGVKEGASKGLEILKRQGSALDAVVEAVCAMEDDPVFNAGIGSAFTVDGHVEMDAAVMDGRDLSSGAVAIVHRVKNPVRLARLVMEKTDHVLIAGPTAEKLARAFSLPTGNPVTATRLRMFKEAKKKRQKWLDWIRKNDFLLEENPGLIGSDTVGAVAVDSEGNFAAAASTGGVLLKLPGRIGDTPLIGAGLYADNKSGAATATGLGEIAVKLVASKAVCMMMEINKSASSAASQVVRAASKRLHGSLGLIAIDRTGRTAAVHNTEFMPWAFATLKMREPAVKNRGRQLFVLK